MQKVATHSASSSLSPPAFSASLAYNAEAAGKYLGEVEKRLQAQRTNGLDQQRSEVMALKADARRIKERFFRLHAAAIYDEVTNNGARYLRVSEVMEAAATRYPTLLPSRAQLDDERALKKQSAKEGRELDQGLFLGQVLADQKRGMHLIHAMLRPKREALDRLAEFRRTGFVDLGLAKAERKGNVGHVTHNNAKFLNAEDNLATATLETAVDLVLLDDAIEVGVLRGGTVQHPKHAGRRVFNAGINLTHLYYGQISFVDFLMERELGFLHKMYRGHWVSESYDEEYEDYVEKPWIAAVESFAIGGGCQLLCIMDRVLAEPGSYFNLPASKEGFIPGAANLRFPRLVGVKLTRDGLFFERKFEADTPEGRLICDEVVPPGEMDAAIERNAQQLVKAGMTSLVANRKALRVAQEPLSDFRRYFATYARQQSLCMYDEKLLENLENSWKPAIRHL